MSEKKSFGSIFKSLMGFESFGLVVLEEKKSFGLILAFVDTGWVLFESSMTDFPFDPAGLDVSLLVLNFFGINWTFSGSLLVKSCKSGGKLRFILDFLGKKS